MHARRKDFLVGLVFILVGAGFFIGSYLRVTGYPPKRLYIEALVAGGLFIVGGIRLWVLSINPSQKDPV